MTVKELIELLGRVEKQETTVNFLTEHGDSFYIDNLGVRYSPEGEVSVDLIGHEDF